MAPTRLHKVILITALFVALIGAIDAAVSREWDLFVVFILALALQVVLVLRLQAARPAVPLRGDLVRWLRERAAATGEPLEQLADRAVATYRADLQGEDADGTTGGVTAS
ncbi:MAG: hypothetical protein ACE5KX_06970 [Acidimicrobiia bacterium]